MSDLIEQLGGYEKARGFLDRYPWKPHSATDTLNKQQLVYELLEYRRQHNIYEAGDLVVWIQTSDSEIYKVVEFAKSISKTSLWIELELGDKTRSYFLHGEWFNESIRHATDEEIKAGKRL